MISTKEDLRMSTATEQSVSTVGNVRRLAQYRPFERGGLDLRAVLHDLVLAAAAMEDGAVDSLFDCQKAFADCWALEVEIDELRPIVDRLVESDLATRHGKGFRLSPATMADLENRAREWQQTEDRALREWELEVRQARPGLAEEEMDLLRSDLRDWLHLIIGRHGADAAMMLYPEDRRAQRFFDDVQAHGFDSLPDRPDGLRILREQALPLFIRAPSPDQRRFLASLLNISFYMNVLTIDPQAKKLVQEQMTGHRIYLDTNFLYAVLGGAPPEEVYSSRRLVKLSKDLGFELAVTPWTVDELRTSIARSRRDIEAQQAFIRPELADAMVRSSGDKGFNRLYWQAYNQSKTQPKDVFDRLEHFELTLESYGIAVVDQGCTAVDQDEARIREYSSLLNSERWPWQKDWVVLEHDAKARLLVERLRGAGNLRFSNARYWFLTYDATLPRFAARVPDNGDSAPELAFCVSPSAWVQIIRALTPRTDDFDRTVVDLLTSPFVGYRAAVSPAVVQEVVGRMDHFEDASPELSIAVMADTAKVHEIEKAVLAEDEDMIEDAVRVAYSTKAREMQDAVATSVRQAAQADDERRSAETRAADADAGRRREQEAAERTRLQIDREREQWDEEKRVLAADLARAGQERDLAAGQLEKRLADEGRQRRSRTILAGVALIVLGLAVALALPLAVVSGKWAIAGAIVGGAALGLLGVRIVAGRNWGGEIVTWGSLLIAVAAVVVAIAGSTP